MSKKTEKMSEPPSDEPVEEQELDEGEAGQETQKVQQPFRFVPVLNEAKRVYTFPDDSTVEIDGVFAIAVAKDGSHRLFTRINPQMAMTVASGWLTIHRFSADGNPYVFSQAE